MASREKVSACSSSSPAGRSLGGDGPSPLCPSPPSVSTPCRSLVPIYLPGAHVHALVNKLTRNTWEHAVRRAAHNINKRKAGYVIVRNQRCQLSPTAVLHYSNYRRKTTVKSLLCFSTESFPASFTMAPFPHPVGNTLALLCLITLRGCP